MHPNAYANWVISLLNVTGSTVAGPHNAVLVGGGGSVAGFDDDDGEIAQDAEAYGAPGIVFRPRPPEDVDTPDGTVTVGAEAMGARTGDGLVPMAWRDLRWNRAFPAPKAGTVALVGYGGGFLSMDDTDSKCGDQKANIQVIYCPYAFNNGVAGKAHAIIMDPEEEAITIVHGAGQSILMQKDGSIRMQSPDGQNFIQVADGQVTISGVQVVLKAGAVIIGDPVGSPPVPPVPMLPGAASPPCPRLFLSPTP